MSERAIPVDEVITFGDKKLKMSRAHPPTEGSSGDSGVTVFQIFSDSISPENFDKPDGSPLRVIDSLDAKVDISKRSVHDMGFWHRSLDFSEVIVCVKGALRWETELGNHILLPGQVLCIPRGVAHRSALCDQSEAENVLIEVKIRGDLDYVGPDAAIVSGKEK
jgi:hypothetical protein